jgi:hypothetical protein
MPRPTAALIEGTTVASSIGRCGLTKDRIVAVGLLTQRDLDVLGTGFDRLFSVDMASEDGFADLMAQLDRIAPVPENARAGGRGEASPGDRGASFKADERD